uniref:Uncharacterized protein n=1 Tax=Rhizophora mucronata TaxID=61149 RepID=A0A2P2PY07_RHIMU
MQCVLVLQIFSLAVCQFSSFIYVFIFFLWTWMKLVMLFLISEKQLGTWILKIVG